MPRNFDTAVVTIGIDPGKNTLHLVGLDARGESCQWGNRCALQEHGTLSALDDNTGHRPDHLERRRRCDRRWNCLHTRPRFCCLAGFGPQADLHR